MNAGFRIKQAARRLRAGGVIAHPTEAVYGLGGAPFSTSANRSGSPPARKPLRVRQIFGERLDDIVVGRLPGLARPTTIRDARTGAVIRH